MRVSDAPNDAVHHFGLERIHKLSTIEAIEHVLDKMQPIILDLKEYTSLSTAGDYV